ncbi:hypothetical protein QVD17_12289 [Tagetes erecta]|uniref:Uncharacterized protein n=1 Tax=Tagetes erecta TaxID=13708 RepID=A0AAD8KUQ6_TARER|nr:hypothetical protein QVD17_12289 [Tagetes erecta]
MSSSISFSFKKLVRGFMTSTHSPGCNCIFKVPANQDHSTLLKKSAIHLKRPCKLVHIWTGFQVQAMVHFLCILSFCGPEKRDSDVAQSFFRSSEYNAVVRDQFDAKMGVENEAICSFLTLSSSSSKHLIHVTHATRHHAAQDALKSGYAFTIIGFGIAGR